MQSQRATSPTNGFDKPPTSPYLGLATQLRTPPIKQSSPLISNHDTFPSYASYGTGAYESGAQSPTMLQDGKKVTPAMRDEASESPVMHIKANGTAWSHRESSVGLHGQQHLGLGFGGVGLGAVKEETELQANRRHPLSTSSGGDIVMDSRDWASQHQETPPTSPTKPNYSRQYSTNSIISNGHSIHNVGKGSKRYEAGNRPRPASPSLQQIPSRPPPPPPLPATLFQPGAVEDYLPASIRPMNGHRSKGSISQNSGTVQKDFSSFSPLTHHTKTMDLAVKLDPKGTQQSTFLANDSDPTSNTLSNVPKSLRKGSQAEGLYEANVTVGMAQRVERAHSFRKASLVPPPTASSTHSQSSQTASVAAYVIPPLAIADNSRQNSFDSVIEKVGISNGGENLSSQAAVARPARPPSPNGTAARPIGQGLRSSFSGTSIVGSQAPEITSGRRRSSSLYIQNPSPASAPITSHHQTTVNGPDGGRLPLALLSLAKRTSHLSNIPGYGWRLHLLEKLEEIMASYLTMQEAESILSIGAGKEKKTPAQKSASRMSQIGMPSSSVRSPNLRQKALTNSKQTDTNNKNGKESSTGFFSKMKRALVHPNNEISKTENKLGASSANTTGIFGAPLSQVAEYGFVTSMIAGQRHDLPGVCFSTVEEIYRRGQGMNVPGLMHLAGEPSRVAKLAAIYDTAPDYGEHHDLSIESIHNVTSLLKKYLLDLPEPILDQRLWRLYLSACVDSTKSIRSRVACAQILLRLLPTPNFSLLVYLVAFLSQMPLFPENRLTLESVSTIFGPAAMSPRPSQGGLTSATATTPAASKLSKKNPVPAEMVITGPTERSSGENNRKAQEGLLWLLTNWSQVADGLLEPDFDVDVDAALERVPAEQSTSLTAPSLSGASRGFGSFGNEQDFPFLAEQPESPELAHEHTFTTPALDTEHRTSYTNKNAPAMERQASAASVQTLEISSAPKFAEGSYQDRLPPAVPFAGNGQLPDSEREQLLSPTAGNSRGIPVMGITPASPLEEITAEEKGNSSSPIISKTFGEIAPVGISTPKDFDPSERRNSESSILSIHAPASAVSHHSGEEHVMSPTMQALEDAEREQNDVIQPKTKSPSAESISSADDSNSLKTPPVLAAEGDNDVGALQAAPDSSVLEEVMQFDQVDENDNTSIYSFPSPPTKFSSSAAVAPPVPASPLSHHSFGRLSMLGHNSTKNSPDASANLVRPSAEQLRDAHQLIETQRKEIQTLWHNLTQLETERTAEQQEIERLQQVSQKTQLQLMQLQQKPAVKPVEQGPVEDPQVWERHRQAGKKEAEEEFKVKTMTSEKKLRELTAENGELKEKNSSLETELNELKSLKAKSENESKKEVDELRRQLDAIRSLLGR